LANCQNVLYFSKFLQSPSILHVLLLYSPRLQPVLATREKQTKLWIDLIVMFCRHNNITVINVSDPTELFENKQISRKLNSKAISTFLDALVEEGRAEWEDKSKNRCFIYWKSIPEWADTMQKWCIDNGISGTSLYTVYELRQGDTGEGAEFHGMDTVLFYKVIKFLEKKKKAEYYLKGNSPSDEDGVKFLL
jgi:ESCRT-II complex subunit VPS25